MTRKTYQYLSVILILIIIGGVFIALQKQYTTTKTSENNTISETKTEPNQTIPTGIRVKKTYTGLINDANALIAKQLYSQAAKTLAQAITQNPEEIEPYLLLGDIYIQTQENEKLKNLVREIGKKFPSRPESSTLETRRLIMNHEYQAALDSFRANEDILSPEINFYYAVLLSLQNNHEEGVTKLTTILESETNEALKNKTEAVLDVYKNFENVNDGQNPHLFALLSKTLAENGESHLAKEFAENAIKEDASYIDAWVLRGYASLTLGEYETALKDLEYAYEIAPERKNTHYFLALTYLETDDYDKATLFFEKVLDSDFEYREEVLSKLISLYTRQEEYEKVLDVYDQLLQDNNNPRDYVNPLEIAIEVLNQPQRAINIAANLLEKNPDNFIGYNFYAWALIANEQYFEAEQTLERALEIKPDNPGSYLYLGLLHEEQQEFQKAIEYYKKSYEAGQGGPEVGITQLAAQKHNQLAQERTRPTQPQAQDRAGNSP